MPRPTFAPLPKKELPLLADRQVPYGLGAGKPTGYQKPVSGFIPIKDWDETDQPREKLMARGRDAVSNAELLAILLGTGTAKTSAVELGRQLMALSEGSLPRLAKLEWRQLKAIKGVGDAKAITIAAALELGRRLAASEANTTEAEIIQSAAQTYRLIQPKLSGLKTEQFWVILLSNSCQVLRVVQISAGGLTGVLADPRVIFKEAILENASSVIMVHNHPSGNAFPSPEDDRLTKKVADAGAILDIHVFDHLIFTEKAFYSYKDANRL